MSLNKEGYEQEQLRKSAWKVALQEKHHTALELIIKIDGPRLVIDLSDIMELYSLNSQLVYKALEQNVMISRDEINGSRSLSKLFKHGENKNESNYTPMTYIDILTALLENDADNQECNKVLSKISDPQTLNSVVALLIVHDRILLMNEVMEHNNIEFDPRFIQVAIESDSFGILFELKDKYLQQFSQNESDYLNSIVYSVSSSNSFWLAKLHIIK